MVRRIKIDILAASSSSLMGYLTKLQQASIGLCCRLVSHAHGTRAGDEIVACGDAIYLEIHLGSLSTVTPASR